jgi:hypothetical protein
MIGPLELKWCFWKRQPQLEGDAEKFGQVHIIGDLDDSHNTRRRLQQAA